MDRDEFNRVLDYAIGKEEEAVQFYQDLQRIVHFQERLDFLKELEEMEQGHIRILEDIKKMEITKLEIGKVEDLKISESLVTPKVTEDLSYQDMLITGMKKEEEAEELYISLAERTEAGDIQNLFKKLASEEAKHKLFFERIYDEEILKEN
jgi:rubrerythrin